MEHQVLIKLLIIYRVSLMNVLLMESITKNIFIGKKLQRRTVVSVSLIKLNIVMQESNKYVRKI